MLHYLTSPGREYTMQWFLDHWAPSELRGQIAALSYAEAAERPPRAGAYVFADLERLYGEQLDRAESLWQRLSQVGTAVRLLNQPGRSARRYELLRLLYQRGINRHNAYRLADLASPATPAQPAPPTIAQVRFPVFLREEHEHNGAMSDLLHDWPELHGAAHDLVASSRWDWKDFLAVEFCDTAGPQGEYATYRAIVIGGRVLPTIGGVTFARAWEEKEYTLLEDRRAEASLRYVRENPHARELGAIAELAGVDYGRFDYALLDGRPEIWELNTNPNIVVPRAVYETAVKELSDLSDAGRAAIREADMTALDGIADALGDLAGVAAALT